MLELLKCNQGSYIEISNGVDQDNLIIRNLKEDGLVVKNPKTNQTFGFIFKENINQIGFKIVNRVLNKNMIVKIKWKEISMKGIQTAAKF